MPEPINRQKIHEDLGDALDELGHLILEPIVARVPRRVAEFVGGFVMVVIAATIVMLGWFVIVVSTYLADAWGML